MLSLFPAAPSPSTTATRFAALLCAIALGLCAAALAREPLSGDRVQYVLLDNGNVLRGDVEDRGPLIAIRDGEDEIRISSTRVRCWAPSLEALYQYRVDHRFDPSATALESDIEWCIQHGLYSLAAREIIALKSRHPQYQRIAVLELRLRSVAAQLSRSATAARSPGSTVEPSAASDPATENYSQPQAEPTSGKEPADEAKLLDAIQPNNLQQFTSAIQPILSNRCAAGACHGGANAADPRMIRLQPSLHASGSERRQALATLLAWIDPSDAESSKLLTYSMRPHGDRPDPPLDATDDDLTSILQQWVVAVASDMRAAAENAEEDGSGSAVAATPTDASRIPGRPQRLPSIADPFDPQIFNNYYQPQPRRPARR